MMQAAQDLAEDGTIFADLELHSSEVLTSRLIC